MRRLPAPLIRLARNDTGSVAIIVAFSMLLLIGMAALGVEVSLWYMQRREMQAAADAAALSGAVAVNAGSQACAEAPAIAAQNGYNAGLAPSATNSCAGANANVSVAINNPPATGPYAGDARAVEAVITSSQNRLFSGLFLTGQQTIRARAVASATRTANVCLLSLNPSAPKAVNLAGGAVVKLNDCALSDNSSDPVRALDISNNATLSAALVTTVGGVSGVIQDNDGNPLSPLTGPGHFTPDPYAGTFSFSTADESAATASCTCTANCSGNGGTYTCPNGRYASLPGGVTYSFASNGTTATSGFTTFYGSRLNVGNGTAVTFAPGTYVFDGGGGCATNTGLNVTGGTVIGNGVTMIFTNGARLSITGGGSVQLNAPTQSIDSYNGMVFIGATSTCAPSDPNLGGQGTYSFQGATYFPANKVSYAGGSNVNVQNSGCAVLVADTVTFTGMSGFAAGSCSAAPHVIRGVKVVE